MPSIRENSNESAKLISKDTPLAEVVRILKKHGGCKDLTKSIDRTTCSSNPIVGGGYSDIYRGKLADGTPIAIKSLRIYSYPAVDENRGKVLKQAARELCCWSKLKHLNVLPLLGLALFRDQLVMVSEWMEYGGLLSYLQKRPKANRLRLCKTVAAGLAYLHRKDLIHGDLKAASQCAGLFQRWGSDHGLWVRAYKVVYNQVYELWGPRFVATLDDYDSSDNDASSSSYEDSESNSSEEYESEESENDSSEGSESSSDKMSDEEPEATVESDVYAYGMTVMEILTGKIPLEKWSDSKVQHRLYRIATGSDPEWDRIPYEPAPEVDPELSRKIWDVAAQCWVRDPRKRLTLPAIKEQLESLVPASEPAPRPRVAAKPSSSSKEGSKEKGKACRKPSGSGKPSIKGEQMDSSRSKQSTRRRTPSPSPETSSEDGNRRHKQPARNTGSAISSSTTEGQKPRKQVQPTTREPSLNRDFIEVPDSSDSDADTESDEPPPRRKKSSGRA